MRQDPSTRRQLRQPRVAELVAASLRDRILDGRFSAGDLLPTQDELLQEFRVSRPSLREALRILETEGLITVQRGNVGGSVVHVPGAEDAAYALALVLQSRRVLLDDVVDAFRSFEPRCAAACAARDDRAETVVPALRANVETAERALDDPDRFVHLARAFHEDLVERCGNETMRLVVGALEQLWSAQTQELARRTLDLGEFGDRTVREAGLTEHRDILDRIAAGDADGAEHVTREHYARPERHAALGRAVGVDAGALRAAGT